MTYDQTTVRILLDSKLTAAQKQGRIEALLQHARQQAGEECPECESTDVEWNGCTGREAGYRCTACDFHFGPDNE